MSWVNVLFVQDGKLVYPHFIHTLVEKPWGEREVVHRGLWITSGRWCGGVR